MKELAQNEVFSETCPDAINELNEIAERINEICKENQIDYVFSFSALTEIATHQYKDSRFVSFGLYCETTSPYIHAASEIVDSSIKAQAIQELAMALQLIRENGEYNCDCPECQREQDQASTKTANQKAFH
ncbi:hypothetical protein OQA07_003255 [Escherichia coli O4]|uniref:hypothetical protein n=1 Tax=Escherichia coli TaxID=562 RepID=UPI000B7D7E09|nr:hypothetical protein [Escherichia coli]EKK2312458.1 hypothetical protein [Escherichia coli O4]EER5391508.1 hypothetical protein [Escherichia coli]EER6665607.1 hypothetical protein [Escherichia coli]EET9013233.1 hypothetical protein [Escherichia coli]EEU2031765.1 hypothetical protein [Escherichia coli]